MIKKYILHIFVPILLLSSFTVVSQSKTDTNWKLAKEKNGITIYTRTMEGTKFKEYKAICVIEASPVELVKILTDVHEYTEWMAFVKEAEVVEKDGEDIFYVYSEVKVPFPFDNRDQITKSVVVKDTITGRQSIEVEIIPDFLPEKKGIVRMPSGHGRWAFTPMENGKTQLYHSFGGNPGGNIPAWIVNMFLVDGPYKTMMGLQEKVLKNRN